MEKSEELNPLQVLPQAEALRQWNEGGDADHGINGKSEQSIIHIQPLPEINGEATETCDTNGLANADLPNDTNTPVSNSSAVSSLPIEAAVTIEQHHPHTQCAMHTAETHGANDIPTNEPMQNQAEAVNNGTTTTNDNSESGTSNNVAHTSTVTAVINRVPMSIGNAEQVLAKVSVEGGGQHTVVVKTEPGLEEETGTNNSEKQQAQASLGVIKTEKDTSEYERSAARHGRGGGSTALQPSANVAPPQPQKEYETGSKVCNVCNRVLSTPEACVAHIANHYKENFRMFECDICKWAFESNMQHNVHKKKHAKSGATPSGKPGGETNETLKVNFPFKKGAGGNKADSGQDSATGGKAASLTCLFCGRIMNSREALKTHQNNHCNNFNFLQCRDCDMCFETKPPLVAHRKQYHNDSTVVEYDRMQEPYISYACKFCQRSFKTEGKLEEHTANHSNGTTLHQCPECGFCFEAQGDLVVHKRNKHKQKYGPKVFSVPCNECGRMFKNDADMEKHLENHYNGSKLHVCSECGFAYEKSNTLQTHRYEKHVKPFVDKQQKPKQKKEAELDLDVIRRSCPTCKRVFTDEALKEAHILNHQNNMDMFKCDVCSWKFEYHETYSQHIETSHKKNSGPTQHTCNTCGRKFKSEGKQIAHIQNHMNDVTMYKCDSCTFEFEDEDECDQHKQKCSKKSKKSPKKEVWKHACDYCGRKFQSETVKAVHMVKHLNNETMHKCAECGWQFEQIHQLTYHLKTHKNDKKTPSKKTPKKNEKTGKPTTVCDQCERQFYYEKQTKTHRDNHFNGTTLYKCLYCPWEYEKEVSLKGHVEQYHPYYAPKSEFAKEKRKSGQKFICPICGRNFMGKVLYVQHLANHTELPFKCPYEKCGHYYADHKQFQNHKQQKHNETKANIKYRLEKMAEEANESGDSSALEESMKILNDSAADAEKSVSFNLMCPRCKQWFANKKEHYSHTIKCKVSYTCGTCKLMFDTFNEFEYHLFQDEMECEVCKKMFASECILQKHLVSEHFSAEMIDESEKAKSVVIEEEKKAAAEAEKAKAEAAAAKAAQRKSLSAPDTPKTPSHTVTKAETTPKSKPTPTPTPKSKPTPTVTPTRASTRSRTTPTHTVTRNQIESDDDNDNTCDENLVTSTVDMVDGTAGAGADAAATQKRKRVASSDSNNVDSSDDPTNSKRRRVENETNDGDGLKKEEKAKPIVCDVIHCNGTFFDEHVYMEHVRQIHSECINIISDEKCSVIQIKDASRATPTQTGPRPASKRKVWTVLRIQCQQEKCKDSNSGAFTTRALYNKHSVDVHSGKGTDSKAKIESQDTKESVESKSSDKRSPIKSERRRSQNQPDKQENSASVEVHHRSKASGSVKPKKEKAGESVVQSSVSSPGIENADDPQSCTGSEDDDDEPAVKKKKTDEETLKDMMSPASYTSLLNDLETMKKESIKTSPPSPAKVLPRRGSSQSRTSPRRKEASKKGNECGVCRKKFGASVPKCLCSGMHAAEAQVKIRALNTSVVSQV